MRLNFLLFMLFFMITLIMSGYLIADTDTIRSMQLQDVLIEDDLIRSEGGWQEHRFEVNQEVEGLYEGLDQLLSRYSTAHIRGYGIGSSASVALRGTAASHTQVYWNGLNLNSPTHGQADLSLFPAFFFDAMTLRYGGSSLRDGSGGIGGNVHLENTPLQPDGFHGSVNQSAGSYNNFKTRAQGGYGTDNFRTQIRLYRHSAENNFTFNNLSKSGEPEEQLDNANLLQQGGMAQMEADISEQSTVTGHFWMFDSERHLPRTMLVERNAERQEDRSYRGMIAYNHVTDDQKWEGRMAYTNDYLLYEDTIKGIHSETFVDRWHGSVNHQQYYDEWEWGVSLDADLSEASTQGYPDGVRRDVISAGAETTYELTPSLHWSMILRQEWADNAFSYPLPATALSWHFLDRDYKGWLNVQASRNRRLPSLNDMYWEPGGNPDLETEKSLDLDAGLTLKSSYLNNRLFVKNELNTFASQIENRLVWEPGAAGFWTVSNFESVFSKGIENHLSAVFQSEEWSVGLMAVYSYTEASPEGTPYQLIYLPKHNFKSGMMASWNRWEASLSGSYTGKQYLNSGNTRYLPAYELMHAGLSRSFPLNGFTLKTTATARNILDKNYQTIAWRPMPGRHYEFSLTLQWANN